MEATAYTKLIWGPRPTRGGAVPFTQARCPTEHNDMWRDRRALLSEEGGGHPRHWASRAVGYHVWWFPGRHRSADMLDSASRSGHSAGMDRIPNAQSPWRLGDGARMLVRMQWGEGIMGALRKGASSSAGWGSKEPPISAERAADRTPGLQACAAGALGTGADVPLDDRRGQSVTPCRPRTTARCQTPILKTKAKRQS